MASPPARREISLGAQDGRRLHVRLWGEPLSHALPLLCLPGLTRHGNDFDDIGTRLGAGRWVVCPSYRGRGRSEYAAHWQEYRPETTINDMRHVVAALGLHRFVVIGTSFGGLVAMALATIVPSAIAGIVLNDIGPDIGGAGQNRILGYIGQDRPQPDWDTAVRHLQSMFPTLSFTTPEAWRRFAGNTYREGADGKLHFDWDVRLARPFLASESEPRDLWALFAAVVPIPVLSIRGELSDVLSADTMRRMQERKPDLRSFTLPKVGHAPTLDESPCRIAIDEFLGTL